MCERENVCAVSKGKLSIFRPTLLRFHQPPPTCLPGYTSSYLDLACPVAGVRARLVLNGVGFVGRGPTEVLLKFGAKSHKRVVRQQRHRLVPTVAVRRCRVHEAAVVPLGLQQNHVVHAVHRRPFRTVGDLLVGMLRILREVVLLELQASKKSSFVARLVLVVARPQRVVPGQHGNGPSLRRGSNGGDGDGGHGNTCGNGDGAGGGDGGDS